ncbi:acyltransferase [Pantoea sp. Bo_2]|uniref:acyltransferase family protein n=1 Tax=unclassified Pantoea TaxID=2630326 RepID=UPI0012324F9D|nr:MULTISPECIES: acyltransferase [unclassified Pantoea]KAA5935116.1 acyltransferase [Pantoea sp. VH_3]KAA5945708.1 acyltransferase [Pantoea sp. VH_25]KAA5976732.1 acyltransferase [Pantoea sp. M_3]KAA6039341.1 acyltransferase [Pantoea sp. FN_2b]KAA6043991.1 acyltransferase [Pantoea sp. Bo_5]
MPENTNKLESIQALRGLAAMLVVMFHFRTDLALTFPIADRIFRYGSIGVDLFFMISGFIAYYVTHNENNGLKSSHEFMIKRLCRILPPYIIATLFVAGKSWEAWQITLQSFLFLPRDVSQIAPYFGYAKLNVGWTLNYEFVFYSLCALSLLFKRTKFIALTIAITFLVAVPYHLSGQYGELASINYGYRGYLATATNGMMLEFLAGILAAHLSLNKTLIRSKYTWRVAIVISVSYFIYVVAGLSSSLGNGRYGFASASFFLLLSLTGYEARFGLKPPVFLTAIGTISFSVYLMHKRGMSVAIKTVYPFYHGHYAGCFATIIALILTAIFSSVFYKYVEVGLCTILRRKLLLPNNSLTTV